jgi:hypothetical protein
MGKHKLKDGRTTLILGADLIRMLRLASVYSGQSQSRIVREAIGQWLARRKEREIKDLVDALKAAPE